MTKPGPTVEEIRRSLDHPVVDGDAHLIESMPLFLSYAEKMGGQDAAAALRDALRDDPLSSLGDAKRGEARGAWWGVTNRAGDLAAAIAPRLLYERLDEIGLDYTILYPTIGVGFVTLPNAELRQLACRALNTMTAELTTPYAERLTAAAAVPMHTPDEAIAELEHAVWELGFKVVMIPPGVARPWPAHRNAFPTAHFVDRFGIDSEHDYDPVWHAFATLGVAVTSHGAVGLRYLDCGRRSPSSYVFNRIGGHAYQQGELAKSLVLGGVPQRLPALPFAFLEGGAGWACDLLHALEEHFEKRSAEGLREYDPARLDVAELCRLLEEAGLPAPSSGASALGSSRPEWVRDEYERSGVERAQDFAAIFDRQLFFGCEGDDQSVYRALDGRRNPGGTRLHAFFSSDIGHWDVRCLDRVLIDSHALVDQGLLSDGDYRDFVFTNPVRLHTRLNPRFFEGTRIEEAARHLVESDG